MNLGYYNSGIEANPLMTDPQQQAHVNRFAGAGVQPGGAPNWRVGPDAGNALLSQIQQQARNANQRASLDFQRNFAGANTGHLLAAENARANSGLSGFNYLQGQEQQGQQQQIGQRNMLLSFLAPYLTGAA